VQHKGFAEHCFRNNGVLNWSSGLFDRGEYGRGVALTIYPPSSAEFQNGWSYTSAASVCLQGHSLPSAVSLYMTKSK
jgi:hypothetical protein